MLPDAKYLPTEIKQLAFLKARIEEYKLQVFGNYLESLAQADNKATIEQLEYSLKKLIETIDTLQVEFDRLEEKTKK